MERWYENKNIFIYGLMNNWYRGKQHEITERWMCNEEVKKLKREKNLMINKKKSVKEGT